MGDPRECESTFQVGKDQVIRRVGNLEKAEATVGHLTVDIVRI